MNDRASSHLLRRAGRGALVAGCNGSDSDDTSDTIRWPPPTAGPADPALRRRPEPSITNSGQRATSTSRWSTAGRRRAVEQAGDADGDDDGGLRTPEFVDSPDGPKAIIKVVNASVTPMSSTPVPATSRSGRTSTWTRTSESDVAANGDNGNNVMQRGLVRRLAVQAPDRSRNRVVPGQGRRRRGHRQVERRDRGRPLVPAALHAVRRRRHLHRHRHGGRRPQAGRRRAVRPDGQPRPGRRPPCRCQSAASSTPRAASSKDSTDQFNGFIDNILLDIS